MIEGRGERSLSILSMLLLVLGLGVISPASAALFFQPEIDLGATGLGNVLTVLTLQHNGSESGCVSRGSGVDVIGGTCPGSIVAGDEKSQTQTRAISALTGITQANDLAIVFNANESQGGGNNSVTIEKIVLSFYTPTGTVLASYSFTGPQVHNGVNSGTGGSGYIYRLDYDSTIEAQDLVFSGVDFGNNRIGLAASVSNTSSAAETFFIARVSDFGVDPVTAPEPATALMVGAGLLGAAVLIRRRYPNGR